MTSLRSDKTWLIITSSSGGGLIQAANAKEQEIRKKYPNSVVIQRDILKDWVWNWLGSFAIMVWNTSQRKGNVAILSLLGMFQIFFDLLFLPQIFFWTLRTLLTEDIDHVIDTQPLCTNAIMKALRVYNRKTGKNVVLEKVFVDFPTKKSTHFLGPIRKLSSIDRKWIKITTIPPALDLGQTDEEFWQKYCSLPLAQINYEPFFVRQSFCRYHKKPRLQEPFCVKAQIKNGEERELIRRSVERGSIEARFGEREVEFTIGHSDLVFTILLGSQPAFEGSLNYVRKFIQSARQSDKPAHMFIFCANHKPSEQSLLRKVSDEVVRAKDYPHSFTVIPLSFQQDDVIAPIFYRSDITCTRSGGQTLMELMCVSPGEIWIHSEAKKKESMSLEELLKGIPSWESGNAAYMQKLYGAKIVTPETFVSHAKRIFAKCYTAPGQVV